MDWEVSALPSLREVFAAQIRELSRRWIGSNRARVRGNS
jgi:hypothetical protein